MRIEFEAVAFSATYRLLRFAWFIFKKYCTPRDTDGSYFAGFTPRRDHAIELRLGLRRAIRISQITSFILLAFFLLSLF